MEERQMPPPFLSINGQQFETPDEFWEELENVSSSPVDEIDSIVLQNAGLAGQRACRKLASTLTVPIAKIDKIVLHLKSLHLEDPKIGPRGIKILSEELFPRCHHLCILNLSNCRMGHFGAQAFVENQISTKCLTELNLQGNNLGDDGVWKLTSAVFSQLASLEELDLSNNSITDNSLCEIGRFLPKLSKLGVLRLTRNSIKATSIDCFIMGMQTTNEPNLVELSLSKNQVEASGALQLAKLLQVSGCSLKSLDLSHNTIGDDGALSIAEAVRDNNDADRSLNKLNVTFNDIGDSGAGNLVDLMDSINSTATDNEQPFVLELLGGNPRISPARINIYNMILKHNQTRQRSSIQPAPLAKAQASLGDPSSLLG